MTTTTYGWTAITGAPPSAAAPLAGAPVVASFPDGSGYGVGWIYPFSASYAVMVQTVGPTGSSPVPSASGYSLPSNARNPTDANLHIAYQANGQVAAIAEQTSAGFTELVGFTARPGGQANLEFTNTSMPITEALSPLAGGGFAVVWAHGGRSWPLGPAGDHPADPEQVAGAIYNADGSVRANLSFANYADLNHPDFNVDSAGLANGNLVVAWRGDTDQFTIVSPTGATVVAPTTVDTGHQESTDRTLEVAALSDGGFVLVRGEPGGDSVAGHYDIVAEVFNADGTVRTGPFLVNPDHMGSGPTVVGTSGDKFLVSWTAGGVSEDRAFDANGNALGDALTGGPDAATVAPLNGAVFIDAKAGPGNEGLVPTSVHALVRTTVAGDGGETIAGDELWDVISGGAGNDSLDGGGGTNTLDYSGAGGGVTVNLGLTGPQTTGGAGADTIAHFQRLIGSSFADTLTGDGGDNTLTGGAGNDHLDGGAGNDVAAFTGARADYAISRGADGSMVVSDLRPGAPDGADHLTSIESLAFSDAAVVLPPAPYRLELDPSTDTGVVGDETTSVGQFMVWGVIDGLYSRTPGSTITLYEGSTVVGSTSNIEAGAGFFQITVDHALPAGAHTLTAVTTNGGLSSPSSAPLTVTVTGDIPAAPHDLALDPASDGGVKGDLLTNDITPTIDGKTDPGATVQVYAYPGQVLATAVADSNGDFAITTPLLSTGPGSTQQLLYFTALKNGFTSSESHLIFTTDIMPPTVTSLSLDPSSDTGAPGDGITSIGAVKLEGNAEGGATIILSEGSTVLGTQVLPSNNGFFDVGVSSPLAAGSHTLSVIATDVAGNASPAATLTVVVDPGAGQYLRGGIGDDVLVGGAGNDTILTPPAGGLGDGQGGDDSVIGGPGADTLLGGEGNDWIWGAEGDNSLGGGAGDDVVDAGGSGNSFLVGGEGNDTVFARDGNDTVDGGPGTDNLWGGAGADVFRFDALADTPNARPDTIIDFQHGIDKIDLSALASGLTWAGSTPTAHAVWYTISPLVTVIHIDAHSSYVGSDATINLYGNSIPLSASDFIF